MAARSRTGRDLLTASELSILAGRKDRGRGLLPAGRGPGARRRHLRRPGRGLLRHRPGGLGPGLPAPGREPEPDAARASASTWPTPWRSPASATRPATHFRPSWTRSRTTRWATSTTASTWTRSGARRRPLADVERAIDLDPGMLSARVVHGPDARERRAAGTRPWPRWRPCRTADPATPPNWRPGRERLQAARDAPAARRREGKVHLLHMVLGHAGSAGHGPGGTGRRARTSPPGRALLAGAGGGQGRGHRLDRSRGHGRAPAGGDRGLELNEISPPIESGGLYHHLQAGPLTATGRRVRPVGSGVGQTTFLTLPVRMQRVQT